MANTSMMINPWALGNNPYVFGMANFANQYSATDTESLYNTSIFNPMMAGYGMCDPSLMGMMGMYSGMMGGMGMMNPMYMMQRTLNPAAYDAMSRGINPMGSLYFGKDKDFQQYNTQQSTLGNGLDSLALYAKTNNQDDFAATYDRMLTTEKERLRNLVGSSYSESELTKAAKANINKSFQAKYQVSLGQALAMNGDSPITKGMKNMRNAFGFYGDKEASYTNVARVNDAPMDGYQRKVEKRLEHAGEVIALGLGVGAAGAVGATKRAVMEGNAIREALKYAELTDSTAKNNFVFKSALKNCNDIKSTLDGVISGKTGDAITEAVTQNAKTQFENVKLISKKNPLNWFRTGKGGGGRYALIAALIAGATYAASKILKD